MPLKLVTYNVIIACDKCRGYIQTIKQLIAFDRKHIGSVKVLQAEKFNQIVSIYFPFLIFSQSSTRYILKKCYSAVFEVGRKKMLQTISIVLPPT